MVESELSLGHHRTIDKDGFFILSDDEIDQILSCCKPQLQDINVQIDPNTYFGKKEEEKFDDHFSCKICQMVVIEAEECGKCQNCFCKKCIKQW